MTTNTLASEVPWTPGPYEVCNGTDVFTVSGSTNAAGVKADHNDGWQVADCDTGVTFVDGHLTNLSLEEKQANARLFSESPTMAAVLERIVTLGIGGRDVREIHEILARIKGEAK